jgi:ATP-dependent DNA helicase RecG
MFGHDPQQFIPHSEIVCIRYADRLGVRSYVNRQILRGTVPELIDKAAEFLKLYIQVGAEIVGFTRIDTPEYPLEALREAVVNLSAPAARASAHSRARQHHEQRVLRRDGSFGQDGVARVARDG